jgi:hypothetical protein
MSSKSSICLISLVTIFILLLFYAFIITDLILDIDTQDLQNITEMKNSNN